MLKISRMSDYAIVLLTAMARENATQYTARALAYDTGLTLPTVGKLLKMLSTGGLLLSQQGRNGGYRLAQPAKDTSLADIIEAIDGPIAMTECFTTDHDCEREASCGLRPHWQAINQSLRKLLGSTSLADLIEPAPQVPVWFNSRPADSLETTTKTPRRQTGTQ
jgi:FeS assembly SUF system regulator